MTIVGLLEAMLGREVEVFVPAIGEWVRVDRNAFIELLALPKMARRMYKAQVKGAIVRIG